MESPLVIAGLGNPGRQYEGTRHNIGYWLVDALAREQGCSWAKRREFQAEVCSFDRGRRKVFLVKPLTFVNLSGESLGPFCRYYRVEVSSLVVVYDELNLEAGRLKISLKGSAGGHNGLASIIQHLGSEFVRFRLGIGPRHPPEIDLKDFVLGKFSEQQAADFEGRVRDFLAALHLLIDSGPNHAMNQINQRNKKQDEPKEQQLQSKLHPRHEGQDAVGGGSHRPAEEGSGSGQR
jgi:peptidyl-tRNA hydrolase, PTH1 family